MKTKTDTKETKTQDEVKQTIMMIIGLLSANREEAANAVMVRFIQSFPKD